MWISELAGVVHWTRMLSLAECGDQCWEAVEWNQIKQNGVTMVGSAGPGLGNTSWSMEDTWAVGRVTSKSHLIFLTI